MADSINRQDAIDALLTGKEFLMRALDDADVVGQDREKYSWGLGLTESYINDIEELPSAEPEPIFDKIISEIEEVYINLTYEENCSRRASWGLRRALEIIDKYKSKSDMEELPSAEPKRKKGKWTATYSDCGGDVWVSWKCSNCGYVRKKGWEHNGGEKPDALFCEMCNADMRGEEDGWFD